MKEHPHAEALRALADGYEVQMMYQTSTIGFPWTHLADGYGQALIDARPGYSFRKKPEVIRFRVAKFKYPTHCYASCVASEQEAAKVEQDHAAFAGWLTDWQEVEA